MPASESPSAPAHRLTTSLLLALLHAAMLGLAYEPVRWWPLAFAAPAPLAWMALRAASRRRAAAVAFAAHLPLWLLLNAWVIQVTPPGYVLMGVYQALYAAAFAWLLPWLARRPPAAALPMTLLVPLLWTALECVRGKLLFDGYPWHLLAQPTIGWLAFAQSADLLGTYFLSFLTAAVSGLIVDGLLVRSGRAGPRRLVLGGSAVVAVLAADVSYGHFRLAQRGVLSPGPRVLIVQTNLPQDNKIGWPIEQQFSDFEHFLELTVRGFRESSQPRPPDLVVWPETMLPGFGLDPQTVDYLREGELVPGDYFARGIARLHELLDRPLLVGSPSYQGLRVQERRWVWDTHFNSAYLVAGDPPYPRYDKFALTPFGERMPYISAWPWLEERLLAIGAGGMSFDLDAAAEVAVLRMPLGERTIGLGTPICYEDAMAAVCRRMVYREGRKRADALINLSNDGWFGRFDGGRAQHNQIARFRCIENRVPMARAVNTGQSVVIDSRGKATAVIGRGRYGVARQDGFLVGELVLDARRTLFGRLGDSWAWACLLATAALALAGLRRR